MQATFVLIPQLLAALLSLALARHSRTIKYVAMAASIASLSLALLLFFTPSQGLSVPWLAVGSLTLSFQIAATSIGLIMLLLVCIINPIVLLYSFGFMQKPSEQGSYYSLMALLALSMMLFAISANFLTMLLGWELLGICAYLLIGFWHIKPTANRSAKKAMTIFLISDLFMLAAIILIGATYSTLSFSAIDLAAPSPALSIAIAMIVIAVLAKSAQLPFSEWLADSADGPAPVSAFLQSSTLLKAGPFLLIVLFPILSSSKAPIALLLIGIASALYGSINALTERHMERMLAYSTVTELGMVLVALGMGYAYVALLMLVVQTFSKALLFLGAGALSRASNGEENIKGIRGAALSKPLIVSLAIGPIALAAIFAMGIFLPTLSLAGKPATQLIVALLLLIELISSTYSFTWLLFVSRGERGHAKAKLNLAIKSLARTMMYAIAILASLTIAASLLLLYLQGLPFLLLHSGLGAIMLLCAVFAAGAAIAFSLFRLGIMDKEGFGSFNGTPASRALNLIYGAFALGAAQLSLIAYGLELLLCKLIEHASATVLAVSRLLEKMENGKFNRYLLIFLIGIFALLVLFVL